MTFKARYDGHCAECNEQIQAGDVLDWNEDDKAVHVECKRKAGQPGETCPICWTVKSVSGACDCEDDK